MYTEELTLDLYEQRLAVWEEKPHNKRGTPPAQPYLPTWIEDLEPSENTNNDEPTVYPDIADVFGHIVTEEAEVSPDWRESV